MRQLDTSEGCESSALYLLHLHLVLHRHCLHLRLLRLHPPLRACLRRRRHQRVELIGEELLGRRSWCRWRWSHEVFQPHHQGCCRCCWCRWCRWCHRCRRGHYWGRRCRGRLRGTWGAAEGKTTEHVSHRSCRRGLGRLGGGGGGLRRRRRGSCRRKPCEQIACWCRRCRDRLN
jgi:hypothetical protein